MNAFFSGTDNANENMTQFYGVWGKVTDGHPAFSFRYVIGKSKIECDPSVLIDWPKMTTETVTKKHNRVTLSGDFSLLDIDLPEGTNGNSVSVDQDEVETTSSFESLVPGPFAMVEYPADWMAQHSTSKFRYSSPSYVYGKTAGAGAGAKNYGRNVETEDWDDWGKDYGYDKREAGQGSLLGEYYRNRFGWKEEEDKVGTEAKKFGAAANAANENEPYLTTEDGSEDLDTAFEESIVVSSEKGELSRELNALAVEIAKEVVLDGNSVIYF